jgi:hypothetical protein
MDAFELTSQRLRYRVSRHFAFGTSRLHRAYGLGKVAKVIVATDS